MSHCDVYSIVAEVVALLWIHFVLVSQVAAFVAHIVPFAAVACVDYTLAFVADFVQQVAVASAHTAPFVAETVAAKALWAWGLANVAAVEAELAAA